MLTRVTKESWQNLGFTIVHAFQYAYFTLFTKMNLISVLKCVMDSSRIRVKSLQSFRALKPYCKISFFRFYPTPKLHIWTHYLFKQARSLQLYQFKKKKS